MSGAIFVFRKRRPDNLKILLYGGEAFWPLIRRLSTGTIKWWRSNANFSSYCVLQAKELQTLIMGGNLSGPEFSMKDSEKLHNSSEEKFCLGVKNCLNN